MPPNPPVALKATDIGLVIQVDYDKPLVPGLYDTANWSAVLTNLRYPVDTVQVLAGFPLSVLVFLGIPPVPEILVDSIDYSPPPFDILATDGGVAQPLVKFPITP